MHRTILSALAALSFSISIAAADSGSAFIQQIGSPTSGFPGVLSLHPQPKASAMDVRHMERALLSDLGSRFGEKGGIEINQNGDRHVATISQDEGSGNIAAVEQRGFENLAMLTQSGNMNAFIVSQWGSGNIVRGAQSGDGNYARISQHNMGNTVRFTQSGMGNVLTVAQD